LDYSIAIGTADIAEFKNKLSECLSLVGQGEEIYVRKYNIPIARVVPVYRPGRNKTRLGCGRGSVEIEGDLTDPLGDQLCGNRLCGRESKEKAGQALEVLAS
jgi:antitoxin (DNA-binding transcriptional repressor) of toxin-antitoxin stability system